MKKQFFVTGTGTDVGKTFCSALLCKHLQADYWKPIQAGIVPQTDAEYVKNIAPQSIIHPERFKLKTPASPHYAAIVENIEMELNDFKIPFTENNLIVEGAGGLMVPINSKHTILDVIKHLKLPVIVVAAEYLGAINHTLMTVEILKNANIEITGLIWNKHQEAQMLDYILQYTSIPLIASIPPVSSLEKLPEIHFTL